MSTVPHATPRIRTLWLWPRDIAADLGVSTPTAAKLLRRIPGAELVYRYENRKGERWRVSRACYDAWRAEMRKAG